MKSFSSAEFATDQMFYSFPQQLSGPQGIKNRKKADDDTLTESKRAKEQFIIHVPRKLIYMMGRAWKNIQL